ncbi:N-terminal L-serine N(alpha)-acetyltransferase NAT4 [Aspergillus clavatus NRRL 1]|uniref:N-alpha-acetyltransferase 40 n=1 Tax=Aspergillus clavatus (strain ATCC 1007 / CBS 513.65 / DSM 816 / NCTC 3887 / NRRL 1 / QM 1276 / 107) TaxID=344612 RepID=A1CHD3_ASPCL|nr:GNAT family acetyltransferase Nat4, putative [Aspergillus clavatus NRRL 1]EAW10288.1 GNAT family acetyltransferase Nat4, putative [Aspergillus clavatus NRRL 1]
MPAVKASRVSKSKLKQTLRRSSTRRALTTNEGQQLKKNSKLLPLVERTNALSIEEFISRYIPTEPLKHTLIWRPKENHDQANKEKPQTEMHCIIDVFSASTIPTEEFDTCFNLIKETSEDAYRASSWGWFPQRKRKEMRLPDMKYLIERRSQEGPPEITTEDGLSFPRGEILAFLSFMVTYEDGKEVIYCYELHVAPKAQRQGLGLRLMTLLESIGNKVGLEAAMLSCFRSNQGALRFYESIGYREDESSPRPTRLRRGEVQPDYYILSKQLER